MNCLKKPVIASTVAVLSLGLLGMSAPAYAASEEPNAQVSTNSDGTVDITSIIDTAKTEAPEEFEETRSILEESDAFVQFAMENGDYEFQLDSAAALGTPEGAKALVSESEGKHFAFEGDEVVLREGAPEPMAVAASVLQCGKAWAAAGAYTVASGSLCGGIAIASAGLGAAACSAGMGMMGSNINFNSGC